jgi:hypothetical protein
MIKQIFKGLVFLAVFGFVVNTTALSQVKPTEKQLENVLMNFTNYRFGKVSVYELKPETLSSVRIVLEEREKMATGIQIDPKVVEEVDEDIRTAFKRQVEGGMTNEQAIQELMRMGKKLPPKSVMDQLYEFYSNQGQGTRLIIGNAYLVTTRPGGKDSVPEYIIALVVTREDKGITENLSNKSKGDIYTHDELKAMYTDTTSAGNPISLYEDMMNDVLRQKNYYNRTPEARGMGFAGLFIPKSNTQPLVKENPSVGLSEYDIQKFKRITEKQPFYMLQKNYELIVSPDLISIKKYPDLVVNGQVNPEAPTNFSLPQWGVELKYGQEAINYPSFWSERLTAYAVWDRVKLGVVLPTDGWASLSADAFEQERRLTHAGIGIAGEADFATKFIPQSGVFNFNFSYLFGDAEESKYKNRDLDPDIYVENMFDNDYLVRGHAQLHYTYGIMVEENYWLRLGVGGTYYAMERWYNKVEEDDETFERKILMAKRDEESIGGVSAKLDFMAQDLTTPFGLTLQYFDEALFTDMWLHIPIVENTLAMRLSAKGYFKAFTDKPHEWENDNVFIPMARFIVNF